MENLCGICNKIAEIGNGAYTDTCCGPIYHYGCRSEHWREHTGPEECTFLKKKRKQPELLSTLCKDLGRQIDYMDVFVKVIYFVHNFLKNNNIHLIC